LAAAVTAAALAHELSPTLAVAITAVAASAGVLVPFLLDALRRQQDSSAERRREETAAADRSKREADTRIRRIRGLVLDWPLSFADVQPEDLGVSPSATAQRHAGDAEETRYVARDVDDGELTPALASHRFVVISGPSKAGKSRTAFEVARRVFADDLLVVPAQRPEEAPDALRELFGELDILAHVGERRVVIWLDDVQRYVRFRAIDAALLRKWRTNDPPVVIVSTIRDTEFSKLQEDERSVLSRAKRITLQAQLSAPEMERAVEAYPGEDFSRGLGVRMVDAPQLIETLEAAASSEPQAYALISAAVDWQRATSKESISAQELYELARLADYRRAVAEGASFRDDALADALDWCLRRLPSGISMLHSSDDEDERFAVFDYLVDYASGVVEDGRGRRAVPDGIWEAALLWLDPGECALVGFSAQYFGAWDVARRAWTKAQEDPEDGLVATVFLGALQAQTGESQMAKETLEKALNSTEPLDRLARTIGLASLAIVRMSTGELEEAYETAELAVTEAEADDAEPIELVVALNAKATIDLVLGRDDALELADRSVKLIASSHVDDDLLLLEAMLVQCRALTKAGDYLAAEGVADRALDIAGRAGAVNSIWGGALLTGRGNARRCLNKYAEAVADVERAHAIQLVALSPEHPTLGDTLWLLGVCKQALGELTVARQCLEDAFALRERSLSPRHPDYALTLYALGCVRLELGEHAAAERDFGRVLSLEEAMKGPEDVEVAYTLHELGRARYALHEFEPAKRDFERALAIKEAALGREHQQVAQTLYELASVRQALGDHVQAKADFERTLAIRETDADASPLNIAYTCHMLADIKRVLRDRTGRDDALRALAIKERELGGEDIQVAYTLVVVALLERDRGELAEAERVLTRALAIKEAAPRPDSGDIGATLVFRGSVRLRREDHTGAERDLERAIELYASVYGDSDGHLFEPLRDCADALAKLGRLEQARDRWEWALAVYRTQEEDAKVAPILAALKPIVAGLQPAPLPGISPAHGPLRSLLAAQRRQLFALRRQVLEGADVRVLLAPGLRTVVDGHLAAYFDGATWDVPGLEAALADLGARGDAPVTELAVRDRRSILDAALVELTRTWDARQAALGKELTRALERFLLLAIVDERWPEYRDEAAALIGDGDGDSEAITASLDARLCELFWGSFLRMLFHVQVNVEPSQPQAVAPRPAFSSQTPLAREPHPRKESSQT